MSIDYLVSYVFGSCKRLGCVENLIMLALMSFHPESLHVQQRPTKRAPDAGDSAHIPSSFLRLIIFLAGRLRRPRPSAGNAHRYMQNDDQ